MGHAQEASSEKKKKKEEKVARTLAMNYIIYLFERYFTISY